MEDINYAVDPQLKAEFIDDSLDGLKSLPELFIKLESDLSNEEPILIIFRTVHSIKGSSAFFELMKIKKLSHELETLLDLVRKNQLKPTTKLIDVLLKGVDELVEMFERVQGGESEVASEATFNELLKTVVSVAQKEAIDQKMLWLELLNGLRSLKSEGLKNIENGEAIIEKTLTLVNQLAALCTEGQQALLLANKKEVESPINIIMLQELLSQSKDQSLSEESTVRVGELLAEAKLIIVGKEAEDILKDMQENYSLFVNSIGLDSIAKNYLLESLEKLKKLAPWKESVDLVAAKNKEPSAEHPLGITKESGDTELPAVPQMGEEEHKQPKEEQGPVTKTMRVTEESVDEFLSYVGELVVLGEMYQHLFTRIKDNTSLNKFATELRKTNDAFEILSNNLQDSILHIRRVPFRTLLQKVPRIIRDVANINSKEIETVIKGETTLVDKSIIDALEAPVVHIVRNAADHGIETPEVRKASGKNPQGLVEITVTEKTEVFELKIKDDGKGLDYKAIARKGVSLGLLAPDQQPSDKEIIDLLFASGVSTASEVTEVSGRGVGMDVVKSSIDSIGGKISVSSSEGKGSEFTIELPKSIRTQIITGFEVVVADRRYILPLEKIVRCFRPLEGTVRRSMDDFDFVSVDEGIVNVYGFDIIFGLTDAKARGFYEGVLIIIEENNQYIALHVDGIEGIKRVVLKEIDGLPKNHDFFQGGAVMGDGSVAMVINIEKLMEFTSGLEEEQKVS
ncbi:chemotaxis protein CheA [bacterium]|nr:chemotaxis protein CheA [bacterium]